MIPPALHDKIFIAAMRAASRRTGIASPNSRDDDESVGHGPFVANRHIDARLVTRWRDRLQAPLGAPRQLHGRAAARQVDHAHIAPPYAAAQPRSQGLGAGLLGGEPLG